jgi:hypothetical protein
MVDALAARVRDDMRRVGEAIAALRPDPGESSATPDQPAAIYGERLGRLLGRRLQDVEGAVAVAMDLADRTGVELREELHTSTQALAEELENVARMAHEAAATKTHDMYALESRFDEVHRRIDAVTRELRAGVAALGQQQGPLRAPYGRRLAETLGRRIEHVEGVAAVASALAERTGAEVRDELAEVAATGEFRRRALADELAQLAERLERLEEDQGSGSLASLAAGWRAELRSLDVRLGDELAALRAEIQKGAHLDPKADLALRELIARIEVVESDRDAITAQLVRSAETWAAERVALQERVAELAARIVTGPTPGPADVGEGAVWPTARAFDQLRINVEGLRMRLAYHEKAVAELAEGRDVDDRIDDMQRLLGRLESAGRQVRGESDTLLEQLESIASRMDSRLTQVERSSPD